ncbi:MAG: NFACT family protein [Schwartzia sp.]|nr:NFACT family protein [Schwartzia sp. (in: firmicutes)]
MSLDGFSMYRLARELNDALAGGRVDKITQPNKTTLQIAVRQPGQNLLLCVSVRPQNPSLRLLDVPLENPAEPPSFCMLLRKHLETGRIACVRQQGLDRVLLVDVDILAAGGRIATKTLAAELTGKYANLILTEDGVIIDALRRVGAADSRVRLVLPGGEYRPPDDGGKLVAPATTPDAFTARLRQKVDKNLIKAISDVCLGVGPATAKEIAFCAGLAPDAPVGTLDDTDFSSLSSAFAETVAALRDETQPAVLLYDGKGKLTAMSAFPLHIFPDAREERFPTMSAMLARADALIGSYAPPDRERFQKLAKSELRRAQNKLLKLREEAAEAKNADEFRRKADTLATYQHRLADHRDDKVSLPDVYGENGEVFSIALDRRLTVRQNIQDYYKRYGKLRRAEKLLAEQIALCEENIRYLESIELSLASCEGLAELADIRAELVAVGLLREKQKKKSGEKLSEPFRFRAEDGTEILVGKNNSQNDRLTFRIAARDDLWLHTKDIPGSHVILRTNGKEPAEGTLLLAASLAAHFSQAAGSSNVPVDCTPCRFVKKPSGAKPGFVIFTHQKTLSVTPDKERLKKVLDQSKTPR